MTDAGAVMFNPLQTGYVEDPYSHHREIRRTAPVQEIFGRWGLFRYDDCFSLLRDPSMSVDDRKSSIFGDERHQQFARIAERHGVSAEPNISMLNLDPPDHTRLRRLVSKVFTPRSIDELRPTIQSLVDRQLDAVAVAQTADLVAEMAFPLPFDVISEMLGMPDADRETIKIWSGHIAKTIDPIISDEEAELAFESTILMDAHIRKVIEWKRENPADDLLTRLIDAEEEGDRLTTDELMAQVTLLFIAGHETTVNLIGTGLYELLRNPEQLHRWRDEPELSATAIDELLRYISPVQISRRVALDGVALQGVAIPATAFVFAFLASANRDPDKFGADADQLDLGRASAGQHLAFGSGSHYCLGASLAKLEAEVALTSFLRRFPHAKLAAEPTWNGRINLRGLEALPLDCRAR